MSNDLGIDRSGNGNNWTVNNITYADQVVDSPTNNFATWNPLFSNGTLSEGNLQGSVTDNRSMIATMGMETGKWYWEVYVKSGSGHHIGIMDSDFDHLTETYGVTKSITMYYDGRVMQDGSTISVDANRAYAIGDIISWTYDSSNREAKVYRNNVLQYTRTLTAPTNGVYFPKISSGGSPVSVTNFGQDSSFAGNKTAQGNQDGNDIGDFYYTPPTGFLALCTKNLPDVAVVPSEHFNTVLWAGTGSSNAISVGFQPDFVWLKARDHTYSNILQDSVRGAGKEIRSNTDGDEVDRANSLTSFDSNGFTVTTDAAYNNSGNNYVAWNWKANGSGSSNTVGDINSTVSANVDSGFSIVTYTATGTATDTVGHGLSQTAEMVFVKKRSPNDRSWHVGHKDLPFVSASDSHNGYVNLDHTGENNTANGGRANIPNATTFQGNGTNGDNMLAYCFHSVDGYSKVGSYTGNGNADGTFVYTGFRPAWVMVKDTSAGGGSWGIYDSKRSPNNVMSERLVASASQAEATNTSAYDFTSNGFKIRTSDSNFNTNNTTFIYLAFSETPFKYSNAR